MTINKYEIITESGQLKLDRVGYSSLSYPFAYGAIPCTWDEDGDPLDVEIVGVTEPLIPGSLAEVRIIGIMKFNDGGEVDDKVIGVLADDKRMDHILSYEQLGAHWLKETTYYGNTIRISRNQEPAKWKDSLESKKQKKSSVNVRNATKKNISQSLEITK